MSPKTLTGETSPFMAFWWALNRELEAFGLPELFYGEARKMWDKAVGEAVLVARATEEKA